MLRMSAITVGVKSRPGRHVAEVVVEFVRTGDQVLAAFEPEVHHDDRLKAFRGILAFRRP